MAFSKITLGAHGKSLSAVDIGVAPRASLVRCKGFKNALCVGLTSLSSFFKTRFIQEPNYNVESLLLI